MTAVESLSAPEFPKSMTSVGAHLLFGSACAVSLLADQLTKAWVAAEIPLHQPVDVFPWLSPILSFTHVQNTGVAFGLLPGLGGLFAILSLLVVAGVVVFRRTLPTEDLWLHGALGLVTGGALGNVIDRIVRGHVLDFVDVNFWPFTAWPVFNIADSAVVIGVAILLVDSLLDEFRGVPARA